MERKISIGLWISLENWELIRINLSKKSTNGHSRNYLQGIVNMYSDAWYWYTMHDWARWLGHNMTSVENNFAELRTLLVFVRSQHQTESSLLKPIMKYDVLIIAGT